MTETPVGAVLSALDDALAAVSARIVQGMSDAELVDVTAALERVKRGSAAVQAEATAELAGSIRDQDASRGVAKGKQGAGVGRMVSLARSASPNSGGRFVGFADALTREMPETFNALRSGRVEEWTATGVVRETAHLSLEHRVLVDETLRKEFLGGGVSGRKIVDSARALALQLDPAGAVERRQRAVKERRVSLRPAPEGMVWLGGLVPMVEGIAAYRELEVSAEAHRNLPDKPLIDGEPDERTRQQVMADVFLDRISGREVVTETPNVTLNLVMSEEAMFRGGEESGSILGHGPIAARHARELVLEAAEKEQVFVRRIYTNPLGDTLVAMDSQQRLFPAGLATFLRLRDQRCATPFCDAPIRHLDHVRPHAQGGPTSAENGQGLCARCNHTKDLHGFRSERDPVTGVTTLITPTGHAYPRTPPPVLGHPRPSGTSGPRFVVTNVRFIGSSAA